MIRSVTLIAVLSLATLAHAAPAKPPAAAAKPPAATSAELDARLDALAMGEPDAETIEALDALAADPNPRALDTLLHFAHHRDGQVRAHTIAALGGQADPRARDAVAFALGDGDKSVRSAAAAACVKAHQVAAVPRLLLLMTKGDEAAADAVAQLANADVARQVAELAGKAPDALIAASLGAMLLRPDLGPESTYQDLVHTLGKLPGGPATDALGAFAKSAPANSTRASIKDARDILKKRATGAE